MSISRRYTMASSGEQGTDFLIGNTGETVRAEFDVTSGFYFRKINTESDGPSLKYLNDTQFQILDGLTWEEYGFRVGSYVEIRRTKGVSEAQESMRVTIDSMDGDTITFSDMLSPSPTSSGYTAFTDLTVGTVTPSYPGIDSGGSLGSADLLVFCSDPIEGIELKYNLCENNSNTLNSFVDNTTTKLFTSTFDEMTTLDGLVPLEVNGTQSGMMLLSADVEKLEDEPFIFDYDRPRFKLYLTYVIHSFYSETEDLITGTPPSQMIDSSALKDFFEIFITPELNNPNIGVKLQSDDIAGNTGWFNENFNGIATDYVLEDVKFYDVDSNEIGAVAFNNPTRVDFTISGVNSSSLENIAFQFGMVWTPESEEYYKDIDRPLRESLFYSNGISIADFYSQLNWKYNDSIPSGSVDGYGYDNKSFRIANPTWSLSGGQLVISLNVDPTIQLREFFDAVTERQIALWMSVTDNYNSSSNTSNRVTLMRSLSMVEVEYVEGNYNHKMEVLTHPQEDTDFGEVAYSGWVKDDICLKSNVSVFKTDKLLSMRFVVEAIKDTGLTFKLEQRNVNLSIFPVNSDDIQQVDIDTTRGFFLPDGNNKNYIKISRFADFDTPVSYGLLAYYGLKIRWEDWLSFSSAPDDFYDPSQENNGKHNDWYPYGQHPNYELNLVIYTEVERDGDILLFKDSTPLYVADYEQGAIDVTHEILRHSDDTVLSAGTFEGRPQGVILENEPVRVEIEYTLQGVQDFVEEETYAVTTIETWNGQGISEIRQISSKWLPEEGNPLYPLDGEDNLKMEFTATNVLMTSCLIDSELLNQSARYEISGRVGSSIFDTPNEGIYEDTYEDKYD